MANTATLKSANPRIPDAILASPGRIFAMLSHPGRVRNANEDACAALPTLGAFVVCDGMGGAAAGDLASRLATETFLETLRLHPPRASRRIPPKPASITPRNGNPYPAGHPHTRLHEAVRAANQAVYRHSRTSPGLHGMGTTLVALLFDDSCLWVAHIGDSRCYRLRHGNLHALTEDHSLVQEQVRAGIISRAQAAQSPIRNIITRAIGSQPAVEPDIASHPIQYGDLYLLASDGLTRELDDQEIARILLRTSPAHSTAQLESACQALIDAANAHGGRDNITVLLVACR